MRKKQMLALFMSLSLLAQGMLFSGCGQKSIGEEPAQTRTETEEADVYKRQGSLALRGMQTGDGRVL